jgi:hypothetical protein
MKKSDKLLRREAFLQEWWEARNKIEFFTAKKADYEKKLIAPFAEVLAKKYRKEDFREEHIALFEKRLKITEVNNKEQCITITYMNRYGEYSDHYIVAIPHLIDCNFDGKDITSNDERIENENKEKGEKEERAEYERLKKKFEGE